MPYNVYLVAIYYEGGFVMTRERGLSCMEALVKAFQKHEDDREIIDTRVVFERNLLYFT